MRNGRSVLGRAVRVGVIGLLLAALAGCSSSGSDEAPTETEQDGGEGTTEEPTASEPTQGEATGGVLRVGRLSDIVSPDGNVLGAVQGTFLNSVYDTLVRLNEDLEPQAGLAESWEFNEDATELTLQLREGVTFHDGKPFTSADVVFTSERVRDPETGAGPLRRFMAWVTEIQAPDDHTVVYVFDGPRPTFLDGLDQLSIVDQATVEGPDADSTANGTGPFKLDEWVPGQRLVLSKNENYWADGEPYLDGIEFSIASDAQALAIQLESGQLDMVEGISPTDAQRLEGNGFTITTQNNAAFLIGANVNNEQMADKRVRQAINFAINRERFAEEVMAGYATPTAVPWAPTAPGFDEEKANTYAFDLDRAAALLDEAGVTRPLELEIFTNAGQPELDDLAQILQSDLSSIGVNLSIQNLQPAQARESFQNVQYPNLAASPVGFTTYEPITTLTLANWYTPGGNNAGFENEQYEQLAQEAATEPDFDRRLELAGQMTDILLDESFVMVVSTKPGLIAANDAVTGIEPRLESGVLLTRTRLEN